MKIIRLLLGPAVLVLATGTAAAAAFDWGLPAWAPKPFVPAENPISAAKVELGRRLFYDRRLSADGSMSCATCHQQEKAFTDGRRVSNGVTGVAGLRNSMSLTNIAYLPVLTWSNPSLKRLELQAFRPIFAEHPLEMGMFGREAELFARLAADPDYPRLFREAFPATKGKLELLSLVRALASFGRTLLSFDSPYDRYKHGGDARAISEAAKRGEALFFGERLKCGRCHSGVNFTDNLQHAGRPDAEPVFHNTGLHNVDGQGAYPDPSHGIRDLTGLPADEGKFRTPTLRNIALTAPYMHDGSLATLRDVIRNHYAKGGLAVYAGQAPNPLRDPLIAGFEINSAEVDDLVSFLESLTDRSFVTAAKFADPFAGKPRPDATGATPPMPR